MSRTPVPLQQHDVNSFRVSQRAQEVTCHLITSQSKLRRRRRSSSSKPNHGRETYSEHSSHARIRRPLHTNDHIHHSPQQRTETRPYVLVLALAVLAS